MLQLHLQSSKDSKDKQNSQPSKIDKINSLKLISSTDAITKAELIWILKCIKVTIRFSVLMVLTKHLRQCFRIPQ